VAAWSWWGRLERRRRRRRSSSSSKRAPAQVVRCGCAWGDKDAGRCARACEAAAAACSPASSTASGAATITAASVGGICKPWRARGCATAHRRRRVCETRGVQQQRHRSHLSSQRVKHMPWCAHSTRMQFGCWGARSCSSGAVSSERSIHTWHKASGVVQLGFGAIGRPRHPGQQIPGRTAENGVVGCVGDVGELRCRSCRANASTAPCMCLQLESPVTQTLTHTGAARRAHPSAPHDADNTPRFPLADRRHNNAASKLSGQPTGCAAWGTAGRGWGSQQVAGQLRRATRAQRPGRNTPSVTDTRCVQRSHACPSFSSLVPIVVVDTPPSTHTSQPTATHCTHRTQNDTHPLWALLPPRHPCRCLQAGGAPADGVRGTPPTLLRACPHSEQLSCGC
jgi:hypothetical protein